MKWNVKKEADNFCHVSNGGKYTFVFLYTNAIRGEGAAICRNVILAGNIISKEELERGFTLDERREFELLFLEAKKAVLTYLASHHAKAVAS